LRICSATHTHTHTHTLSYTFSKNLIFKTFLGPFPGPRGHLPLIFEFPYFRYISSNFFPPFDLNSHFLLHGTAKGRNCTVLTSFLHYTKGCPTHGPAPYMAHILSTSPLEAVEPHLHRHPIRPHSTPSLASVQSPRLAIAGFILLMIFIIINSIW